MALYSFQVRLLGTTGLADDIYENVLWYEVNAPDTVQGRCDNLAALYSGTGANEGAQFLRGFNKVEVRAYANGQGQPVANKIVTSPSTSGVPLIHEVAVCLSYAATDDPQESGGRRRGRIYLGPTTMDGTNGRPSAALQAKVLGFGQKLAAIGTAGNTTWVLYSRTDASAHKIESIWTDDTWDIQRRRGLAPTSRTVQDVQ